MAKQKVEWLSAPPQECDLCKGPITDKFYDMKTLLGPWGCLCESRANDRTKSVATLGTGYGQRYERNKAGRFMKTGG